MRCAILLSTVALLAVAEGVCPNYVKDYYEEIGCRSESNDVSGCPMSYDCSSLTQRNKKKCHYKGRSYDQGYRLESTSSTACLAECRCQNSNDRAIFSCVNIECPELFNGPPAPGCYRVYEHGKCCHVDEICGDSAVQKTPKAVCEYKGEVYSVGQKFYPEDAPCLQCICQPNFNGSLVEPFCRKVHCNLELLDGSNIAEGCIPIYYGENGCCPIDWRCPEESDAVVTSNTKLDSASSSGKTCKFGKMELQVGEKLIRSGEGTGEDVECKCRVPPHPLCIQKENS